MIKCAYFAAARTLSLEILMVLGVFFWAGSLLLLVVPPALVFACSLLCALRHVGHIQMSMDQSEGM